MRRHIDNRGDQEHNNYEKKILGRTGYFQRMLARLQSAPTELEGFCYETTPSVQRRLSFV